MKFSFVLLTWNRPKVLDLCLKALFESIADRSACEIVVMDNGSTDSTRGVLASYRRRAKLSGHHAPEEPWAERV